MADLFDKKANDWDSRTIPQQLSATIGPEIIKQITLDDCMHVMDFGAGTGLLTAHIVPLVKEISAVDISQAMLDQLVSKPEFHGKVTAHCQNILEKPLDKTFDLIISAMAMHHVEDTSLMLQRFAEHLNSGALVALADLDDEDGSFHPPHTEGIFHLGFKREVFTLLLQEAGFENISFSTVHTVNKEDKSYPIFLVTANKR